MPFATEPRVVGPCASDLTPAQAADRFQSAHSNLRATCLTLRDLQTKVAPGAVDNAIATLETTIRYLRREA